MSSEQPEASGSTSTPVKERLVTFVVDGQIPRTHYDKLVESDGVVHRLVQRLMEKHGGESHVRLVEEEHGCDGMRLR